MTRSITRMKEARKARESSGTLKCLNYFNLNPLLFNHMLLYNRPDMYCVQYVCDVPIWRHYMHLQTYTHVCIVFYQWVIGKSVIVACVASLAMTLHLYWPLCLTNYTVWASEPVLETISFQENCHQSITIETCRIIYLHWPIQSPIRLARYRGTPLERGWLEYRSDQIWLHRWPCEKWAGEMRQKTQGGPFLDARATRLRNSRNSDKRVIWLFPLLSVSVTYLLYLLAYNWYISWRERVCVCVFVCVYLFVWGVWVF